MEIFNLILGIIASIASIISVVWNYKNTQSIKKINRQKQNVGNNSAAALGNGNKVQNGRYNKQ
ncbi:hypothetical protein A2707_00200 [Candidatus Saccharibacteria bacterium RIFCSPHIGHO2_01_FULL_45_15]|nr:MAG: hypothetical protein A2707_00200 [Candidatus Saccharibacteria bacterium RIFCSPHIGHO2_01_FULL_45_15]OGL28539.1 MAG: hypothetical protein A3C39_03760 [Candidatus Saccharibacteria bacterium RIFCSPHIGHO2_02_FULL_46_12]OGL32248.1 MAG: hypothetical protein A3E76_06340 [Candidatus Saccharibacteria bacterium RIFCSPHIGHO2_12_FULL_44_22]